MPGWCEARPSLPGCTKPSVSLVKSSVALRTGAVDAASDSLFMSPPWRFQRPSGFSIEGRGRVMSGSVHGKPHENDVSRGEEILDKLSVALGYAILVSMIPTRVLGVACAWTVLVSRGGGIVAMFGLLKGFPTELLAREDPMAVLFEACVERPSVLCVR